MELNVKKLKELLEDNLGEKLTVDIDTSYDIATIIFENNNINLSIFTNDDLFTISNLRINNQGQGIGSIIFETIIEFCEEHGYSQIHGIKNNGSGAALCEKFGFESDGNKDNDYTKYL
jgi:N-acetylglutamate synthase-like GNAT family acetyltransferase